ncbi:MAG: cobyrinate a,c-diamide synthase, partial [Pseudomonadota bacterium]
ALRPELSLAGALLNRIRSPRHATLAEAGLATAGVPCLGTLAEAEDLRLAERHLGLVQAPEHPDLEAFLERAAARLAASCDLEAIAAAARPIAPAGPLARLPPIGQRIAIARDEAFTFTYPHLLEDWQAAGASIHPFSPLADDAPDGEADAVFLPGGYPELHAGCLAAAARFKDAMRATTARIYGECGGYMVLGETLKDADGRAHPMLGLLPLRTSFASRKLHLGYRRLTPLGGPFDAPLNGHEFHYATTEYAGKAQPLFAAEDADGAALPDMGMAVGTVSGSFAHLIAPAP